MLKAHNVTNQMEFYALKHNIITDQAYICQKLNPQWSTAIFLLCLLEPTFLSWYIINFALNVYDLFMLSSPGFNQEENWIIQEMEFS